MLNLWLTSGSNYGFTAQSSVIYPNFFKSPMWYCSDSIPNNVFCGNMYEYPSRFWASSVFDGSYVITNVFVRLVLSIKLHFHVALSMLFPASNPGHADYQMWATELIGTSGGSVRTEPTLLGSIVNIPDGFRYLWGVPRNRHAANGSLPSYINPPATGLMLNTNNSPLVTSRFSVVFHSVVGEGGVKRTIGVK